MHPRFPARGALTPLLVLSFLAGCASPPAPSTAVPIDVGGSARFVLPAARATDLNERNAATAFASAAFNASRVQGLRGTYGVRQGLDVTAQGARVTVGYFHESGQPLNRTHNLIAQFEVGYAEQGTNKVLSVRCPDSLSVEFNNGTGLGTFPPIVSREQAVGDLRLLCKNLRFTYKQRESGEANANYGDAAVYANFARKLQAHSWLGGSREVTQNDIAKFKWFKVYDGTQWAPVGITVYPYRNGSKVTYTWTSEYVCRADGQCAHAITPQRMQELVTAIAND